MHRRKAPIKCAFERIQSLCVPLIIYSTINGLLVLFVYGMDYIITFSEEKRTMILQIMLIRGEWFLISYFFTCVIYSLIEGRRLYKTLSICCGLILALAVSHIYKNGKFAITEVLNPFLPNREENGEFIEHMSCSRTNSPAGLSVTFHYRKCIN